MRLRIIAGSRGGRYIETPPGRGTRPTAERVREAWMSALAADLPGAHVLDLFAGSGALGIEALSRGAALAHFVESDRRVLATLRGNLRGLDLEDRSRVVAADVFGWLEGRRATESEPGPDLCLADPPYRSGMAARLTRRFRAAPFARLLCIEHAPGELDSELDRETAAWRRRYGDTELTFVAPHQASPGEPDPPPRREEEEGSE